MTSHRHLLPLAVLVTCGLTSLARAQNYDPSPPPPPPETYPSQAKDSPQPGDPAGLSTPPPVNVPPGYPPPPVQMQQDAPLQATPSQTNGTPEGYVPPSAANNPDALQQPAAHGPMLDGHLREGPFLSGPGSFTFVVHHTLMGATGGLVTQGVANRFSLTKGSREGMLIGTLLGAGVGFGTSAWWQFNHWTSLPTANFGIWNSLVGGMFTTGLFRLFSKDPVLLAWAGFLGAELGAG